jgi:hypothetical protein
LWQAFLRLAQDYKTFVDTQRELPFLGQAYLGTSDIPRLKLAPDRWDLLTHIVAEAENLFLTVHVDRNLAAAPVVGHEKARALLAKYEHDWPRVGQEANEKGLWAPRRIVDLDYSYSHLTQAIELLGRQSEVAQLLVRAAGHFALCYQNFFLEFQKGDETRNRVAFIKCRKELHPDCLSRKWNNDTALGKYPALIDKLINNIGSTTGEFTEQEQKRTEKAAEERAAEETGAAGGV